MDIGTLLDLQEEIQSKGEYNPSAREAEYRAVHMKEYVFDTTQFLKTYEVFNDRNTLDYFTLAERDFFKHVPRPKDPFDWRNFIRSGDERNNLDKLLSFILNLNFKCEPKARDYLGNVSESMGEFAESFLDYLGIMDESDIKDAWTDAAMFTHGTVFKQVKFVGHKRVDKTAEEWKPERGQDYSYKTRLVDEKECVEATLWKPNRVYLADVAQPRIEKQDHIWYETVIPYANAYKLFHDYPHWQFVKPYNAQQDQWTDTETDVETEQKQANDKVRVRFRESLLTNEYTIYCNRVLMTPVGLKLPEDDYSMFYQQASLLQPTGAFAYGRSYMDNVRSIVGVKDVLTSVLVDTARQGLEPPLKSRFRTMVNRYMFKPATVTPMQGEGDLTPLIPPNAIQNFVFEALKVYEEMQNKSSPVPILTPQSSGPDKTKRQVELEMQQAISAVAGMIGACVNWRKQEARLKLKIGLKHLSKITGFKFEVDGSEGITSRNYEFGEVPGVEKAADRKKRGEMIKKLMEAENLFKPQGMRKKFYIVDPQKAMEASFTIDFRVNPQARDSNAQDQEEALQKIAAYRQAPNVNQRAVDKKLVRIFHDDDSEMLMEEKPPQQPGMPPQGQPGQPGQLPQQGASPQSQPPPAEPNTMQAEPQTAPTM